MCWHFRLKRRNYFSSFSQASYPTVPIENLAGGCCESFRLRRFKKGFQMHHCYHQSRRSVIAKKLCFFFGFAWISPVLLSGCLALSIPSVRYHDPEDRGGLLGPQRPANSAEVAAVSEEQVFAESGGESSILPSSCTGCGGDDCAGECEGSESEKPPEVPWPRFHPLPTRPVFTR